MASLNEEIVEWANSRPTWQRHILARLAAGQKLEESHYREIASKLSQQGIFPTKRLNLADTLGSRDSANQVSFLEIAEVLNVNALTLGQNLTFAGNGITVVYGDNGSGKSGYARLLKQIAGARDREEVLTDIFTDPEYHDTVDTFIAWSDEILNWHHTGHPSNGRIEGTNNLLQVLRRSAHGFTNPRNFEARGILVT